MGSAGAGGGGPYVVSRLQQRRPLHLGDHARHELGVEFYRVDADLAGLRGGGLALGAGRAPPTHPAEGWQDRPGRYLEAQGEAARPHPSHVRAQQVVGEQLHGAAALPSLQLGPGRRAAPSDVTSGPPLHPIGRSNRKRCPLSRDAEEFESRWASARRHRKRLGGRLTRRCCTRRGARPTRETCSPAAMRQLWMRASATHTPDDTAFSPLPPAPGFGGRTVGRPLPVCKCSVPARTRPPQLPPPMQMSLVARSHTCAVSAGRGGRGPAFRGWSYGRGGGVSGAGRAAAAYPQACHRRGCVFAASALAGCCAGRLECACEEAECGRAAGPERFRLRLQPWLPSR